MVIFKRAPVADPFAGANALVTGGGNGIGRATATRLAAVGANVTVTDIDGDAAAKTAAEIGGKAEVLDVRDRDAWRALASRINDEHGALDILVNNAGVGLSANMLDSSDEDWDWVLGINLVGMINGCAAFGPAMVERKRGHIVNVSSGLGYVPRADQIAYVTSKAGILEFTRSLRADWKREGLTVSAICPGLINSGIDKRVRFKGKLNEDDARQTVYDMFAKGRPPERVANAILDAIRHNKAVVPVGYDAAVPWRLRSFMPAWLVDAIGGI